MESYVFESPIGLLKISEENGRLTGLGLQRAKTGTEPGQAFARHSELLYEGYRQITEYFAGKRRQFTLPLCCEGTAFQKRVWEELRTIPYGETRSYQDVAVGIGSPGAVRAVGQANHRNPLLLLVPCHRVIQKNGDIGGFGCGSEVKRYLLELEKEHAGISL